MYLFIVILVVFNITSTISDDMPDKNAGLYLTPFIESNKIEEGRKLAEVTELEWKEKSYSGYFTVDKRYDSNMFFWYFPSLRLPDQVPLLLWLNGFSTASTYGVFLQNGAYGLNGDQLVPRNTSWCNFYNILYIDNPVGVGFSYTKSPDGYTTNLTTISANLYNALQQFFLLFPEVANRELYLTGLSQGGKYISSLAYRIYMEKSFNFKGIFLGNPLLDTLHQMHYKEYLYELGFVDTKEADELERRQNVVVNYLKEQNYEQFYASAYDFLLNDNSFIVNVTGVYTVYDYENRYVFTDDYFRYINTPQLKQAVHVGDIEFNDGAYAMSISAVLFGSTVAEWLATMVEDIKIMIYVGQLDIICAYPMLVDVLSSLNWSGKDGYANADRVMLYEGNNYVWGYLRNHKTLTDVLVRRAGHSAVSSQPDHILELLLNFTDYQRFN